MDVVEEQLASVHGEMTTIKGDLQRLGSLEAKMEVMLEKMTFLERMERLLQKSECSGKAATPEIGPDKTASPEVLNFGSLPSPLTENSGNSRREIPSPDRGKEQPPRGLCESRSEDNRRIEILSRRLEMSLFEGWNPEGWIFRVEHYFNVNRLTETKN